MSFLRQNWLALVAGAIIFGVLLAFYYGIRATRNYHEACHKQGGVVLGGTGYLQCVKLEAGSLIPAK